MASYFEKQRLIQKELSCVRPLLEVDASGFPHDVRRALEYISINAFDDQLNVSTVLTACDLRSHNISGRFTRHVGMGMRRYIENLRVAAAMRLLSYPSLEIYMIAAAVGYAHHESFTRAFKRHVGCSPSAYRGYLQGRRRGSQIAKRFGRRMNC